MNGNPLIKLGRVIGHLATHPQHIVPYLTTGPLTSLSPLELGLPWFSQSAIEFLKTFVTARMKVFEYGSGGSTLFFAQRVEKVISTEDNEAWFQRVRSAVAKAKLTNIHLQHRPFDFDHAADFERSSFLHSLPDHALDIIVVDCMEGVTQVRPRCFALAETRIAPGGIIIVDDSWRYPELRTHNRAKSWREFRSTGPCRPGVTSTDVFFY